MSHFLSITDLRGTDLIDVLETAHVFKWDPSKYAGALAGKQLGLFFAKPSLRTWVACDVAANRLGMNTVAMSNTQIGLGTREAPQDVGQVLDRYLDALGMRVFSHADLEAVAESMESPVINLLSDREHPCQALADLMTIGKHRPLPETVIAYIGDGNNVFHSLVLGATALGATVWIAHPPGNGPDESIIEQARRHGKVVLTQDPQEAVTGADVVYTDVWTSMGDEEQAEDRRARFAPFQVNEQLYDLAEPEAIFMHCLPAHRGEEVTDGVIDHPLSMVYDQAENRMHSFAALLLHLLG